jgi:hypothetical protein
MAEAFVKTLKREYVRVSPIPSAAAALSLIDTWMELQHRAPEFPAGLPLTQGIHHALVPTCRVSGLTGSCVDGPRRARGFDAEVSRSGADMCPACRRGAHGRWP